MSHYDQPEGKMTRIEGIKHARSINYGLAEKGRHAFLNQNVENIAEQVEALKKAGGDNAVKAFFDQW